MARYPYRREEDMKLSSNGQRTTTINTNNLFDDEDVDDDDFVNTYRSRFSPPQSRAPPSSYGNLSDMERQRQVMMQRHKEIEQRTLDSSARSLAILRESEQIGVSTAEELVRQREQLENTNRRLDDITTNLNTSQKHLNGIKSVFYGFKNYVLGRSDPTPPRSQVSSDFRVGSSSSNLDNTIDAVPPLSKEERYNSHPATQLRGLDEQIQSKTVTDSQRVNAILDANLEEMAVSISRLKGLGAALGEEIDTQNSLIDQIQDKAEVADIKIGKQNKQINKLLGK